MFSLNPKQQEAIETVNGPILILAGAGSGKTRTLTQKVSHLIQNKYASPENILAVTFTNKAASEMKERIAQILGIQEQWEKYYLPWVGTFHSMCVQILKRDGQSIGISRYFSIYDTTDQKAVVREALKELNISSTKTDPNAILSRISSAKSELVSSDEYIHSARGYFEQIVAQVYPIYERILINNSALDFDDLILKTVYLLNSSPEVLSKYQDLFKYILIDEYQDTNHAQYIFSKLLAQKHQNICVVGDDAQSIYAFRGANITNILNFEKDYPNTKIIKLEQNYRSTKKILRASNEIINKNPEQKKKSLWTDNTEGEDIIIYEASDEKDEADWIVASVKDLLVENVNPREIAVLYRTNAMSRNLEEALLKTRINYRIISGIKFYQRAEVKDIVGYLKVIANPDDLVGLMRIINTPKRGIGEKTIEKYMQLAKTEGKKLLQYLLDTFNNDPQVLPRNLYDFAKLITELTARSKHESVSLLIDSILDLSGYRAELMRTEEGKERLENILELKSLAMRFDNLEEKNSLEKFLEEIALIENSYNLNSKEQDFITLMTIHSAKGLEFEHVFIAGMEENIFPHRNSMSDMQELNEERRLAYVALTRAKKRVYISHAESRVYFGTVTNNPVSRFVDDIPEDLITYRNSLLLDKSSIDNSWEEYSEEDIFKENEELMEASNLQKGDLVKHEVFGIGEVVDIDDFIVLVKFSAGLKELALEYVKLERI